jgi:hypothetical protein
MLFAGSRSIRAFAFENKLWESSTGNPKLAPKVPVANSTNTLLVGSEQESTFMSRTVRVLWRDTTSGWKNFNWGGVIDQKSVIHISASEGTVNEQSLFGPLNAIGKHRGDATIYVKNIRPHADQGGGGGVEFYLQVDCNAPLDVVTDITVVDPAEQGIIV